MKQARKNRALILSALAVASGLALVGCNANEPVGGSSDVAESSSSSIEETSITGVAISNKDALTQEWKAGGDTRVLEISFAPSTAEITAEQALSDGDLTVISSNPDVVSVSSLALTPLSKGDATITVSYKDKLSDSVSLTVLEADPTPAEQIATLEGFMSAFKTKLQANIPTKYGVVRSQTNLKGKVTTNQISVERTTKESLIYKDELINYKGILGDYYYTYNKSEYSEFVDVAEATAEHSAAIESAHTAELDGGTNLASGDISIYLKYDATNELHGTNGYEVTESDGKFVVNTGFYIDPISENSGSGTVYEYTYTLNAELLPLKVVASRLYVNTANWDFSTHALKEGGTATFTHNVTFTNFDYSEPAETDEENPLFDVTPYFVTSIDNTKIHIKALNESTYAYEEVDNLTMGQTFIVSLDEGAYSPDTALDGDSIHVTAVSDANTVQAGETTCKAIGIGDCVLTLGTTLHPELATISVSVAANPNIGTADNPIQAYFSSWDNPSEHIIGSWTTDGYNAKSITFTAGEAAVTELCNTKQTGTVLFEDLNASFGIDSEICTAVAEDYSDNWNALGTGKFTITFTPLKAGTTSIKIKTDAENYLTIPVTVE